MCKAHLHVHGRQHWSSAAHRAHEDAPCTCTLNLSARALANDDGVDVDSTGQGVSGFLAAGLEIGVSFTYFNGIVRGLRSCCCCRSRT